MWDHKVKPHNTQGRPTRLGEPLCQGFDHQQKDSLSCATGIEVDR